MSPLHSPDRKRRKIGDSSLPNKVDDAELTFEEFDSLPIAARNQGKWNALLQIYPQFWLKKCYSWRSTLNEAYDQRLVSFTFFMQHFHWKKTF